MKSRSAKIDRGKKNLKEIKRKKEQIAERRIMRNGDINRREWRRIDVVCRKEWNGSGVGKREESNRQR